MRNDIAGREVTKYLKLLLRKEGFNFNTTAEFEIVKNIKEVIQIIFLDKYGFEILKTIFLRELVTYLLIQLKKSQVK
jgi:centractin